MPSLNEVLPKPMVKKISTEPNFALHVATKPESETDQDHHLAPVADLVILPESVSP